MEEMPEKLHEKLAEHQHKYKSGAWDVYTLQELGNWVHLFAKRAKNRATEEKVRKDLNDAKNYLAIMETTLDKLEEDLLDSFTT